MRPRRRRNENGETPSDARPTEEARKPEEAPKAEEARNTPTGPAAPNPGGRQNPNSGRRENRPGQNRGRGSVRERSPNNSGNRPPANQSEGTSPAPDRERQPGGGNQPNRGRQGWHRGSGGRHNRPAGEGNAPTQAPKTPSMETSGPTPENGNANSGADHAPNNERGRRQQGRHQSRQQPGQPSGQQPANRQPSGRQNNRSQRRGRGTGGEQPRQLGQQPRQPGQQQQRQQRQQAPQRPIPPSERSFSPDEEAPGNRTNRPNRPNRRERKPVERVDQPARPSQGDPSQGAPSQGAPAQSNRQGQQRRGGRDGARNSGRNKRPGERSSWGSERYAGLNQALPTTPIRTNRGIKARSQRGAFSKNWWARRWIESMEQLVDPGRLQRGRSYARSGQVLSLQETQNGIEAKVQGSRPQPYSVVIQVTPLTDAQWDLVIDALAEQALFTAQLLAGEMPADIEEAFNTAGVSLFPNNSGDLYTDCTCPDWANPCKHVAATHYILGDRFDDDPFLIFRMRGRSQEEILQALRARRAGLGDDAEALEEPDVQPEETLALEDQIEHFWEPAESLDTFPLTIRPASIDMPLLKRTGEPAFLIGDPLETLLKPAYDTFMRSALLAAYSDEEPLESSNGNGNNHDEVE